MKNEHLLAGFTVFVSLAFLFTWFYVSDSSNQILGAFEWGIVTNPLTAILASTFLVALLFFAIVRIMDRR
jgi:hypothetical protein